MKAIIIGAGRGSRLGHETDHIPKTLVEVVGRPMLDHILDALAAGGFTRKDVVFVCGYAEAVVRERYPDLTFVRNADWEKNNILASLLCAREHLQSGFVSTYADIVYEPGVVERLVRAKEDIVLGCDTDWRRRYVGRTQHPETDAEKLTADGRRVTALSRRIPSEAANGEFIGVMKLSAAGARSLCDAFDAAKAQYAGRDYREGRSFERAYLIDLLAQMLEAGTPMYREDTQGGYMEIDTQQDLGFSKQWWQTWTLRSKS
ncbi:MAG TPA: phosphocholine cytidylyltransferase family protein [Polyangiaceae bacterium]|jgi:choline kinase|nr:phosphocholine cytidylyltransferase family protein [Polyangiaceae bacterium]